MKTKQKISATRPRFWPLSNPKSLVLFLFFFESSYLSIEINERQGFSLYFIKFKCFSFACSSFTKDMQPAELSFLAPHEFAFQLSLSKN